MTNPTIPAPPLHFRLATPTDGTRLIALINSAFAVETFFDGTRTDEERLKANLQKGEILVAENASGQLLACIYLENRGARGYLGQLAVDPAMQRTGLGRRIVLAAENRLRSQGCEAVEITVLNLRSELPPIYRRFGYIETATEPFHSPRLLKPGAECHCIVMTKRL